MPFVIETKIGDQWENISGTTEDGVTEPTTYPTWEVAQAELDRFMADMTRARMDFDPDEYRVAEQ